MKQKVLKFMQSIRNSFRMTPKGTIMWVRVPMTCTDRQDKDDIIISTINHLEQTIKIK
jgi:hypothetical protein